jgi:serine/threonine-protein kinase
VPRRDGTDLAKVVDFGIAKATRVEGQRITRTGVVIGTPAFMSPEQLAGESDLDGRSDQYALGLIAFELLTGARAFPARTFGEATRRMVAEPPKLSEHRPDVAWPPGLQQVIDRALALDRTHRWPTATAFGTAFAQTIQAWQAPGTFVPGFAPGLVATPAVARRRMLVAGAVLLALIAVTVVLTLI